MNKLQQRIENLQGDENNTFCKRILQINFNSWHYSDSNLWASLITKIFDDLQNYSEGNPENLDNIFKNLNSTKEHLHDTEIEKKKIENEISDLKKQKQIFDQEVRKNSEKLTPLNFHEIFNEVIKNSTVQSDIENLKKEYDFFKIDGHTDIENKLNEINSYSGRIIESIRIIYSFRHGKSWIAIFLAFAIFVIVMAIINNSELAKLYLEEYKIIIASICTLLSQILFFIRPYKIHLNNIWTRLKSLKETKDTLEKAAMEKYNMEQKLLDEKITIAQNQSEQVQQKIDLLSIEQKHLEKDITEIASGKRIIRFIESKVSDERYLKNLGIISWIRKDFEQLDTLLRQQNDINTFTQNEQPSIRDFELDRIILYIDDLDRCSEDIVVKVLEAIHLLLAFPLFVVVVGVDPRWMHRALDVHYARLLSGLDNKEYIEKSITEENGQPASSFDYLEKIFQIPFALKPMGNTGTIDLIKAQFIIKKEKKSFQKGTEKRTNDPFKDFEFNPIEKDSNGIAKKEDESKREKEEIEKEKKDIEKSEEVKPSSIKAETLIISNEEVKFIQDVSPLFCDSPRTIKRYSNIYRIIRTHNKFYTSNDVEEGLLFYKASIIMLAIVTGHSNLSKNFIQLLSESDENLKINDMLSQWLKKGIKRNEKEISTYTLLLKLLEKVKLNQPLLVKHFIKNMELVSRFSFK
jgi:hypothetical protein